MFLNFPFLVTFISLCHGFIFLYLVGFNIKSTLNDFSLFSYTYVPIYTSPHTYIIHIHIFIISVCNMCMYNIYDINRKMHYREPYVTAFVIPKLSLHSKYFKFSMRNNELNRIFWNLLIIIFIKMSKGWMFWSKDSILSSITDITLQKCTRLSSVLDISNYQSHKHLLYRSKKVETNDQYRVKFIKINRPLLWKMNTIICIRIPTMWNQDIWKN